MNTNDIPENRNCTLQKCFLLFLVVITLHLQATTKTYASKVTLKGKVTDKSNGQPIPGATIYIAELKSGTASAVDGTYSINDLPAIKVLVQVKSLGYKTLLENIDLSVITEKNFELETAITEVNEVVITGMSKNTEIKRSPVPIVVVDQKYLQQNLGSNIIDGISHVPGVNAVSTGPNVSKPFIRGLGYNRVLTLFDGVRQEGQQWGDEHGIEVDEYSVDRIEIIKGPASLTYGSDAMAGVVNLIPPNPARPGSIFGEVFNNYQSNNRLIGNSFMLAGNENGLAWRFRASHKMATNYENKIDGRVYGTGFQETDASAFVGINKQWGFSHLNITLYDDLQEIPDGSRDSLTRKFTKQITEADTVRPIVSNKELNQYQINTLHQHVQHYRVYSANTIILGEGKLEVGAGFQESIRREYSHPQAPDVPGLYLQLQTFSYDLKYHLPEWKGIETTVGVNGMYQENANKGTEFIIPDYKEFDIGPFAFVRKAFDKLDISGGIRYDNRSFSNSSMYVKQDASTGFGIQVQPPDTAGASHPFADYKHTFSGVSGSAGATYVFFRQFFRESECCPWVPRSQHFRDLCQRSASGHQHLPDRKSCLQTGVQFTGRHRLVFVYQTCECKHRGIQQQHQQLHFRPEITEQSRRRFRDCCGQSNLSF